MADRRWKDYVWPITTPDGKSYELTSQAQHLAVLMDIRDELKKLNTILSCPNFTDIPHKLERIARQTKKRQRPTVKKPNLRVVRG